LGGICDWCLIFIFFVPGEASKSAPGRPMRLRILTKGLMENIFIEAEARSRARACIIRYFTVLVARIVDNPNGLCNSPSKGLRSD
jgi:hypothetical protein